jgi:hypothetical protein
MMHCTRVVSTVISRIHSKTMISEIGLLAYHLLLLEQLLAMEWVDSVVLPSKHAAVTHNATKSQSLIMLHVKQEGQRSLAECTFIRALIHDTGILW